MLATENSRTIEHAGEQYAVGRVRRYRVRYAPDARGEYVQTDDASRSRVRCDLTRAVRVETVTHTLKRPLPDGTRYIIVQTIVGKPNDARNFLGDVHTNEGSRVENWSDMGQARGTVRVVATL